MFLISILLYLNVLIEVVKLKSTLPGTKNGSEAAGVSVVVLGSSVFGVSAGRAKKGV